MFLKTSDRPLLIYILGWGRSGSSILANVIGSLEGGASCGEVRYIWDRGVADNTICGCGQTFDTCDFWPKIRFGEVPFGNMSADEAMRISRSIGSNARPAQGLALYKPANLASYVEKNRDDLRSMVGMYENIFEQSGARVVVDSSKSPFYAVNLLEAERNFDVFFLHLVRDPRAVLYSWRKEKKREEGGSAEDFPKYSALRSLMQWRVVNAACARFQTLMPEAYSLMRYEDFVTDWQANLVAAAPQYFGQTKGQEGANPKVHAQHSISGNPSRFNSGEIKLKRDTSWEGNLKMMDTVLIKTLATKPARQYGYVL